LNQTGSLVEGVMEDRGGHRGLHSSFPRKIDVELGRGKVKIRVELRHQHSLKKILCPNSVLSKGGRFFSPTSI
jgi:hypothetical protein